MARGRSRGLAAEDLWRTVKVPGAEEDEVVVERRKAESVALSPGATRAAPAEP